MRGGIHALARHPQRDEILIGGADGVPQVYRMERVTIRRIGDNANLIRKFPAMEGRIFAVDFSPDGKTIVCGSRLPRKGRGQFLQLRHATPRCPPTSRRRWNRSAAPRIAKVVAWTEKDVKLLKSIPFEQGRHLRRALQPRRQDGRGRG